MPSPTPRPRRSSDGLRARPAAKNSASRGARGEVPRTTGSKNPRPTKRSSGQRDAAPASRSEGARAYERSSSPRREAPVRGAGAANRARDDERRPSRDAAPAARKGPRPYERSSDARGGAPRRDRYEGTRAPRDAAPATRKGPRPYERSSDARGISGRRPAATPRRDRLDDERDARSNARTGRGPARGPERDVRRGPRKAPGYQARPLSPEQLARQKTERAAKDKGWGSVARKGAVHLESTGAEMDQGERRSRAPEPMGDWELVSAPVAAPRPKAAKSRAPYALPGDVAAEVRRVFLGTAYMREKTVFTLTKAAEAYDRHRYEEALRLGRSVADAVPGVASVRELTGLAAYRAERWAMSKVHLRAHFTITGDPEHLPLVMDAERAVRHYRAVEKIFAELQESEPTAEVLAEGRIVMAEAWADQRLFEPAIELLTKAGATKLLRNPGYRHLRLWYALGDVYDRAGDLVGARELFARVVLAEPDAYDAKERLVELGASAPRKNRKRRTTPVSKKRVD
ncbi:MAG TPA: hypothetical protein VMU98_02555 [Acidimicrobiales bacterium]|nr:hypothetical protein [Acidimicrobiales bacterium]